MSHSKTSTPKKPKRHAVKSRCTDYANMHPDFHIDRVGVEHATCRAPSTIDELLEQGKFPQPLDGEGKRFWRYGDILEWLRSFFPTTGGRSNG